MVRDVSEIDLPRVEAFLQKHIATSLFLLSNLAESGCRLTEHLNSGNFKYVEENHEICAVFCLTRRGNMLAQTGGRADLAQAILNSSENEPISIHGVVAEWTIAEALWKLICENSRFHPTYTSKETLFSLKISSANTQKFATRQVRALEPPDFEDWVKLNTAYLVEEGLPVQGTLTERHDGFVEQTQAGYWWGAFVDNKLVATAALNATHGSLGQVGGVYTLPEMRRKGFARGAMELLMSDSVNFHHLDRLILFTGEHNVAAIKMYEGLSFKNIGQFALLFGDRDNRNSERIR